MMARASTRRRWCAAQACRTCMTGSRHSVAPSGSRLRPEKGPSSRAGCRSRPNRNAVPVYLAARLGQVEQGGFDPAMHVLFLRETELGKDRIDVFLDGALGQEEPSSDGGVVLALRHGGEHLVLSRGQVAQGRV